MDDFNKRFKEDFTKTNDAQKSFINTLDSGAKTLADEKIIFPENNVNKNDKWGKNKEEKNYSAHPNPGADKNHKNFFTGETLGYNGNWANNADNKEVKNPLDGIYSNILFDSKNHGPLYIEYKDGKIYGGSAMNGGIMHDFEMDWDHDLDVDKNIQNFYDYIVEKDPSYLDDDDNEQSDGRGYNHIGDEGEELDEDFLEDLGLNEVEWERLKEDLEYNK